MNKKVQDRRLDTHLLEVGYNTVNIEKVTDKNEINLRGWYTRNRRG